MTEAPYFVNEGAEQVLVVTAVWRVVLITNPMQSLARHNTLAGAQETARALEGLGHRVTIRVQHVETIRVPVTA